MLKIFINGVLEEEMHMFLPPSYEECGKYYKMEKVLYDLKQSLKMWFERLTNVMRKNIYSQGNDDHIERRK